MSDVILQMHRSQSVFSSAIKLNAFIIQTNRNKKKKADKRKGSSEAMRERKIL